MNIYEEIKLAFEEGSFDYLEDDIHWGDDSDVVYEWSKKLEFKLRRKIKILYAGVGPGFILTKILIQKRYWSKIVAIDYSQNMLNLAKERLKKLAKIEPAISRQCSLRYCDLLKLGERFQPKTFDMILCFNNTLGNVLLPNGNYSIEENFKKAIKLVIENFSNLLRKGGYLIVSVYNIEKFNANSKYYTQRLRIRNRISEKNFLLAKMVNIIIFLVIGSLRKK